jgi:hypothetical protein
MATNTPNSRFGNYYENAARNITNTANSFMKTANTAANSMGKSINSMLPLSSNSNTNKNSLFGLLGNNNVKTNSPNVSTNTNTGSAHKWIWPLFLFMAIAIITIVIIVMYKDKILAGIHNINQKIRDAFNKPTSPPVDASKPLDADVTDVPVPPQDEAVQTKSIFDKIIPSGNPEVFNVSKNEFTYYDAEPLCRALGAELATYDQLKDAWSKGADWCNYGWVKGQTAVYPIQEETYKKIQSGPDDERNSCGVTGLNGGFFDNPELKFGVNCYGIKPAQSNYDEEVLMRQGQIPRSVPSLAVDRKVQEFKKDLGHLGLLPFNEDKWRAI